MGTRHVSADNGDFTLFFTINSPFSNFFPCYFEEEAMDGRKHYWNCVEHFYMYNKAICFGNKGAAEAIFPLNDPKRMKTIGSEMAEPEDCKWAEECSVVMKKALTAKFVQNDELRYELFMTHGSQLVECSPTDRVWGIGLYIDNENATNPSRWRGENKLGKIMDEVRDELWEKEEYKEERTKVEDGLAIPGFAAAYFEAKYPYVNYAYATPDFKPNGRKSHSDRRNGSGRREPQFIDRKSFPANVTYSREHTRDSDRRRDRERKRSRSRSPSTPPHSRYISRRSASPRRRPSHRRHSPRRSSPAKKRSRRERNTSSSSTSSRDSSRENKKKNEQKKRRSRSPVKSKEKEERGLNKSADDMVSEFMREYVIKDEEKNDVLGPELPGAYQSEDKHDKKKRDRVNSNSSDNGRDRSRSREKKRKEERMRKSRSHSREKYRKRSSRKSRSPAHKHRGYKKSHRGESEDKDRKRHISNEKKKERKSPVREEKKVVQQAKVDEKVEEVKKKETAVSKLMSGLLNKKKQEQTEQYQQMAQAYAQQEAPSLAQQYAQAYALQEAYTQHEVLAELDAYAQQAAYYHNYKKQ